MDGLLLLHISRVHARPFCEAAEARILQIEAAASAVAASADIVLLSLPGEQAMDRRGRVSLHMAETAAEKEVADVGALLHVKSRKWLKLLRNDIVRRWC